MTTPGKIFGRKPHEQDRLATGAPRYGGGSNAATIGTVDPSGYVDRERRSGLAKALLQRQRGAVQPSAGAVQPSQVGETASRMDRQEIVRRLATRMQGG